MKKNIERKYDNKTFCRKTLVLLKNPEIAEQMGQAGFKRVNKFSLTKMLKDIDSLYDGLLNQ